MSLLTTNFTPCSSVSIVNFEQGNAGWGKYLWHKGLIKSFAFTYTFPRTCAMCLIIAIHSVFFFFCWFYLLCNYAKTRGNTIKLNLEE